LINKPKVVVGMSGGVDSSVAAALLKEQGYEVIGLMMHLWMDKSAKDALKNQIEAENDAKKVADILGIKLHIVNFEKEFKEEVVNYFLREYKKGLTPNPCVHCNKKIKFGYFYDKALELGADFISTGHYAKIVRDKNGNKCIGFADNKAKDQSYVLYNLSQDKINHLLLPLSKYTKDEIRSLAKKFNLPVFNKKDSQEICFIPDNDYKKFLQKYGKVKNKKGLVVNTKGEKLGEHKGIENYTIGQRKGLGIAASTPMYVVEINPFKNEIVLGDRKDSMLKEILVKDIVVPHKNVLSVGLEIMVKIRYNAKPAKAYIKNITDDEAKIVFDTPLMSPAPGQSAVFYKDDCCIGGGIIAKDLNNNN
jgi:tRNA-specific 2-thiouridylase